LFLQTYFFSKLVGRPAGASCCLGMGQFAISRQADKIRCAKPEKLL
jgi:hypothetical protein